MNSNDTVSDKNNTTISEIESNSSNTQNITNDTGGFGINMDDLLLAISGFIIGFLVIIIIMKIK